MTAPRFVEVALPLPVFQTFTYAVDREPAHPLVPGTRVIVPVRQRRAVGICLGISDRASVKARPILDVPDAEPVFSERMLSLCRWMAEYYVVPLGVVLRSAMPAALAGATRPTPEQRTERIAVLVRRLPSLELRGTTFGRGVKPRALTTPRSLVGRSPAATSCHLAVSRVSSTARRNSS